MLLGMLLNDAPAAVLSTTYMIVPIIITNITTKRKNTNILLTLRRSDTSCRLLSPMIERSWKTCSTRMSWTRG